MWSHVAYPKNCTLSSKQPASGFIISMLNLIWMLTATTKKSSRKKCGNLGLQKYSCQKCERSYVREKNGLQAKDIIFLCICWVLAFLNSQSKMRQRLKTNKKPDKMNFNVSKELGKTSISLEDGWGIHHLWNSLGDNFTYSGPNTPLHLPLLELDSHFHVMRLEISPFFARFKFWLSSPKVWTLHLTNLDSLPLGWKLFPPLDSYEYYNPSHSIWHY